MNPDTIKLLTVILQIALQVFCVGLAGWATYHRSSNGQRSFWWWFMVGFLFQLVRRAMYFLLIMGVQMPELKEFTFAVVPTVVSMCYAIAMWNVFKYVREKVKCVAASRRKIAELTERLGEHE